jgi:hypothetical protein
MTFFRSQPGLKTLGLVFLFFAGLQTTWLLLDQRALVVERHFLAAAQIAHEWRQDAIGAQYPEHGFLSPYPPLLAYWSAPGLALAGVRGDVAVLTLLPFAWLLLWSVWKIARLYMSEPAAVAAATLALAFHHVVVAEPNYPAYPFLKEYLLDLPLSALVAWSLYLLLRVHGNDSLRYRLGLGLAAGLGALTKVSYPLYLAILLGTVYTASGAPRPPWRRWLVPAVLAAAIALPWYAWHAPDLIQALIHHEFNPAWAAECGMPPVFSAAAATYAGRLLLRLLSAPLALAAAGAFAWTLFRRPAGWKLAAAGALLSQLVLLLVWGKSERLLAPVVLFPALALGLAADLPRQPAFRTLLAGVFIVTAACRMILMNGFVPPAWLRTFPEAVRAEIAPSRHDWALDALLDDMERHRDPSLLLKTAVVPFLGRFRHASLQQKAGARSLRLAQESEWTMRSDSWRDDLESTEFIVTKTGSQGPLRFTPNTDALDAWLREREDAAVRRLADYPLPDGSLATLWHHRRTFPAWSRFAGTRPRDFLASFDENIRLLGYEIRREPDRLELRFQWWCDAAPDRDVRLFIQVREGYRNLTKDSFTPGSGVYPTALWKPASGLVETYVLPLPETCRAGDYDVWIGWHRRRERLGVRDSIFPLLVKALCIGKTAPRRQGALAILDPDAGPASPLRLPPLPGR